MNRSIVAARRIVVLGCIFFLPGAGQTVSAAGRGPRQDTAKVDDRSAVVDRAVAAMRANLAGHEKDPAGDVFKNLGHILAQAA